MLALAEALVTQDKIEMAIRTCRCVLAVQTQTYRFKLAVQEQAFDSWHEKIDKAKFTTGKTTAWHEQILESLSKEQKKLFDDKAQTAAWYEHTHKIISSIASALTKQEKFYEAVALRRVISAASKQQLAAACEQLEELNRSRPHVSAVPKRTIGVDQTLEKFTMTQDEVDEAESLLHCVLATFGPRHRYVLLTKRCLALLQEQKTATRVAKRVSRVASTVAKKRKVIG